VSLSKPEPRRLTEAETELLSALLAHDFPGVEELRVQVRSARVVPGCKCECGTIEFCRTTNDRPSSHPVPVEAEVLDHGGGVIGGLLLFATEAGQLSVLEVYSYDGASLALPSTGQVRWWRRDD
jgi:hypothetical protein